jgi:hypothetical protein
MLSVVALLSCQPAGHVGDVVPAASGERMPAFAGAVGFGRNATGWRGGAVIKVTNRRSADGRGPT